MQVQVSTHCTTFFDFGLSDITSVKRHPRQRILGSLMSGSYLRIHETNNLNLRIRYITHHLYHCSPDSEIRIRIVIHRVYIAL
jgi:hypothetical protein